MLAGLVVPQPGLAGRGGFGLIVVGRRVRTHPAEGERLDGLPLGRGEVGILVPADAPQEEAPPKARRRPGGHREGDRHFVPRPHDHQPVVPLGDEVANIAVAGEPAPHRRPAWLLEGLAIDKPLRSVAVLLLDSRSAAPMEVGRDRIDLHGLERRRVFPRDKKGLIPMDLHRRVDPQPRVRRIEKPGEIDDDRFRLATGEAGEGDHFPPAPCVIGD